MASTAPLRTEDAPDSLVPYQEVRDFFHYRDNYVDELDVASEALAADIGIDGDGNAVTTLEHALVDRFGIRIVRALSASARATASGSMP